MTEPRKPIFGFLWPTGFLLLIPFPPLSLGVGEFWDRPGNFSCVSLYKIRFVIEFQMTGRT